MLVPLVLAGGSGSRLWPISRQLKPKQFLRLEGRYTMLQATLRRLKGIEHADPVVICNEEHRFLAAEQLRQAGLAKAHMILEPIGRNTAPAIALAALDLVMNGEDPLLLVLPADHYISDDAAFVAAVKYAVDVAQLGKFVSFGVPPTHPETGYGYIEKGRVMGERAWNIKRFVEKPSGAVAEHYISTGQFFWNSGMFLFRASAYLDELGKYSPGILEQCKLAMNGAVRDRDFTRIDVTAFTLCDNDSIDYAVMEKTNLGAVVALEAGWSDVGSWSALSEVAEKDELGNSVVGNAVTHDVRSCYVRSDGRLLAVVGVEDLIVVDTKDSVLVVHKNSVQSVKDVVAQLKSDGRSEYLSNREVYRPWGFYDSIDAGPRYQVKRITVNPGGRLSLQQHHHRAEHWIIVSGTAKVVIGDECKLLTENQSVYIPIGVLHRLENPGHIPLELIEVQSGSYLGEDDIVRFDDLYGRC